MLASQSDLAERFEQAREQGDLPGDADTVALASYLFAALQGLAVQAAAGVERSILEKMIGLVLRAF